MAQLLGLAERLVLVCSTGRRVQGGPSPKFFGAGCVQNPGWGVQGKTGAAAARVFPWSRRKAQLASVGGRRGAERNTLLTVEQSPSAWSPGWPSE